MADLVLDGIAIAAVDDAGTEYRSGHIVVSDGLIAAVADGPAPTVVGATRVDGRGCLATPGLVNTHHHLSQWITRGYAQDGTLFEWLTTLYPLWAKIDAELEHAAASAALAALALTGCSTTMDHQYIFPSGGGDLLGAEVAAAQKIGLRFHPSRGSMDLGASSGGLPPDDVVEGIDAILGAYVEAVNTYHDPSFGSKLQIALAPCSPNRLVGIGYRSGCW